MKLYFAVTGNDEPRYLPKNNIKTLLCSYHYYKDKKDIIIKLIKEGSDIFIDSGAFSAQNAGKFIDIDKYCKFLIETKAKFYAGLDVIGNAQKTMDNQIYMEEKYNLSPIPTFHMGEGLPFALKLAQKYPYIAIGGMVFSEGIEKWLTNLWNQLLKVNPNIKCHAFGLTNSKLIEQFPWESIDSSSFKSGRRFGRLILYNELANKLITKNFNNWIKEYAQLTTDNQILEDSAYRYELTDVLSAKSYNKFVSYLNSKNKDYSHLTAQQTLF